MSEWKVMLDVSIIDTQYVEADSEEEAVLAAANASNILREGGDYTVFEATEVRQDQDA